MASDDLFPFAAEARQYPLGTDIAGSTSLDYALSVVDGNTALAHRILRRLTTPRGGLFYAPDYGYNVADLIGSTVPPGVVEQRVVEQMLAEEEVEDADCEAVFATGELTLTMRVVVADGPFALVLTADDLTISALVDGVELFSEDV